jgi:putative hydrolase of the HAD superfamily
MSQIQAVFFDLGDTLVKIGSTIENEICKKICEVRGTPLSVEEYTRASHEEWRRRSSSTATSAVKNIGCGAEEIERQYWWDYFRSLLPRLGLQSEQSELIKWLVDTYTDPRSFVCFPEVHTVLSELKNKDFILGIISNAFPSAGKVLDHLKLRQYFNYILLSFELPYAKPESTIYQFAAQEANIPIESIAFVDDRLSFVQGAEKVNMNAWLIDRFVDDPSRSTTQPLVLNKIENLRELFTIINRSNQKMVSNDPGKSSQPFCHKDSFLNICDLLINSSSKAFFEETSYDGRNTTVSTYLSRVPK